MSRLYPRTGTLAPGGASPCRQGACWACLDLSSAALWAMSFCFRQGSPNLVGCSQVQPCCRVGPQGKMAQFVFTAASCSLPKQVVRALYSGESPTRPGIREELLCCAPLLLRGICTLCLPSDHGGKDFLPMGGISPTKLLRAQEMF